MKYIKMLGLLAVAAAALMAFAGTAAATTITSPAGTVATPTIKAHAGHGVLHNKTLGTTTTCTTSEFEGKVEGHGAGVPATGKVTKLTFSNCGTSHITVLKTGTLSITGTATTNNGTLTSSGAEITIQNTSVGISCIYSTNNTHIGTVTGGTPAVLKIASSIIPRTGHSAFCGSEGQWTGEYKVTSPATLLVH